MTAKPGSVLCILSPDGSFSPRLAQQAQQLAFERHLPLAIVYCIETELSADSQLTEHLAEAEVTLVNLGIPLITLIGDKKEKVMGLSHHVHPLKVFMATSNDTQKTWTDGFTVHKYPWPGVVVPLLEIIKLQNNPDIC